VVAEKTAKNFRGLLFLLHPVELLLTSSFPIRSSCRAATHQTTKNHVTESGTKFTYLFNYFTHQMSSSLATHVWYVTEAQTKHVKAFYC